MQNKIVILALLGGAANADAAKGPVMKTVSPPANVMDEAKKEDKVRELSMKHLSGYDTKESLAKHGETGAMVAGMGKSEIHQSIRDQARMLDIKIPTFDEIKSKMSIPNADEESAAKADGDVDALLKSAQATSGDSGDRAVIDMTDADQACYASRYSDIGAKTGKEHFKLVGNAQGRLGTCARNLTKFEAEMYLKTNPELQQKFGEGASAIKQARRHYTETGYQQAKFQDKMKDTTKNAWLCGVGARQSCKCHGTLWYGPTVALDDKKPISTWEAMRNWKTMTKQSDEWMSCTDAEFGGDPAPEQDKQCWCEDKPAVKPYPCAAEMDECACDGGWVVYAQAEDDGKPLEFFDAAKKSMAVIGLKGKKSVQCSGAFFDGADPSPDAKKQCFCDKTKAFFDQNFVTATRQFWKASSLEKMSDSELERQTEHVKEVARVMKEKETAAKEAASAAKVENDKALADIAAAKTCAAQAIEEAYKFRKLKLTQRKNVIQAAISKRREAMATRNMQLAVKTQAMKNVCTFKKGESREAECKRITLEVDTDKTDIQIETEKIDEDERMQLDVIIKEEAQLELKRTKDSIAAEEKGSEDKNEIKEANTEKDLDTILEKDGLLTQQHELLKIQQDTSHRIDISIKEEQKSIGILITNLKKKMTAMARKEQIMVSELSDDAPEREKVVTRILTRSKETIAKLTTVMTTLTDKVTEVTGDSTKLKGTQADLSAKGAEMSSKITAMQESLKLKIAERKSKREILQQTGQDTKTPQTEGAIVSTKAIDKLTEEIGELRKKVATEIQQKNESFTLLLTTKKEIDLYATRVKIIDGQIKLLKDFISQIETTITTVENKIKEELAVKTVIDTQKAAFKANQELVDSEEQLNSARVISETEKAELQADSKKCKTRFDTETADLKRLTEQLATVTKALKDAKAKGEQERLGADASNAEKAIADATKLLDETTKECKSIDDDVEEVVTKTTEKIAKVTKAIEEAKTKAEAAEKEAKASILTLPGGEEDKKKAEEEAKDLSKDMNKAKAPIKGDSGSTSVRPSPKKDVTGKVPPTPIPAPKPKKDADPKAEDKKPAPQIPVVEAPVIVKKDGAAADNDEDDGEEPDDTPDQADHAMEAEIEKEVIQFTKDAHQKRVDLVKTRETLTYELGTIKKASTNYKKELKTVDETITKLEGEIESAKGKIENVNMQLLGVKTKAESQALQVTKTSEMTKLSTAQTDHARYLATKQEWEGKVTTLADRRKQIKYIIEIKVLESKESEQAVLEAIKTVTDVELLSRKRWLAAKSLGDYKTASKFMAEYKAIYDKQLQTITTELAEHQRRLDVAAGAIASLKVKKKGLADAKESPELTAQLAKIDSEIERHEKDSATEGKVVAALHDKKTENTKEFTAHVETVQKLKAKAAIAQAGVNDAATTLQNQREYQIQVTNLKNALITSHEEALTKREEARKVFQNYTRMITRYEQQHTLAQEQMGEEQAKLSAAQETQRLHELRVKEVGTLMSRTTISPAEKAKLGKEEAELKEKIEVQKNAVTHSTKAVTDVQLQIDTLFVTIKAYKNHLGKVKKINDLLEKKVGETKAALKPHAAPPVAGKASDDKDADKKDDKKDEKKDDEKKDGDKDDDGDDKVDEDKTEDVSPSAVAGGNIKIDKLLEASEKEGEATTEQMASITKSITDIGKKAESVDKTVVTQVKDVSEQESTLLLSHKAKDELIRRRERQRCTRLFPSVFSSFEIRKELTAENMCPCPGKGKGLTQLILDGVEDPGDFDKFVLGLFEKNLAIEGVFQAQMQRYFPKDDKVVSEETNPISLRIVCTDDKIDQVMQALDSLNMTLKSTDLKLSPLLKGKAAYQAWQQQAAMAKTGPSTVGLKGARADADDDDDEETPKAE